MLARDFDNPYLSHYFYAITGGSTGAKNRADTDLDHLAYGAHIQLIASDVHGLPGVPTVIWYDILPDSGGVNHILRGIRMRNVPHKWFSPITSSVGANLAGVFLSQAQTLRVKRMEPIPTSRGKLMPLHVAQRAEGSPIREKR